MNKNLIVPIGVVILLVGLLWMLQGLNVIGGSGMSGQTTWAIVGPIVALGGLALAIFGVRSNRRVP